MKLLYFIGFIGLILLLLHLANNITSMRGFITFLGICGTSVCLARIVDRYIC
jgi:hypothetical protein